MSLYCRLGSDEDAHKLFDELPRRDLVSWNSRISGFSRKGNLPESFYALHIMRSEFRLNPNGVTLLSIVSACTSEGALVEGKYVHGIALKTGLSFDPKLVNSLVNMYGKLGFVDSACRLFEEMPVQNSVSWNSVIAIHTQNGLVERGFWLFKLMRRAGVDPDQATIMTLLGGCANLATNCDIRELGEGIHGYVHRCGFSEDINIATGLLSFYAKWGGLNQSRKLFGEMKAPDLVGWTAMLAAYAVHGYGRESIELFELMVNGEGLEPDHVTFTLLLNACSHSGLVQEGEKYFKIMTELYGIEPRLDHYACMVDLLGRSGLLKDAYGLIQRMPMKPNARVWGGLLGACKVYGDIELGTEVAERLYVLESSDARNYVMLSNIYSAAGMWKDAARVKALMEEKGLNRNPGFSFMEHSNSVQ